MRGWTPEAYATATGALVSVIAAAISVWSAQRQARWDAGRALGEFRADTLELVSMAFRLDNPTWRRISMKRFAEAQRKWERSFGENAPIIGKRAYRKLETLAVLLDKAKEEVLGMPLGGLAAEEAQHDDEFEPNFMSNETSERISEISKMLSEDRAFLTR